MPTTRKGKSKPEGARAGRKAPARSDPAPMRAVFARLKQILEPYIGRCRAITDTPAEFSLVSASLTYRTRPLWFGGVRMGKNYVSFHLMPVYALPALKQSISPRLKKRMQGKSCFNFTAIDEELFGELERLTAAGADQFMSENFLAKMASGGVQCE
jgi:hypothetical protein